MWIIIVSLIIGVCIGYFFDLSNKYKKFSSVLQQLGVILLLFSMGASAGANKSIVSNLRNIGKISVTFAILTSIFSIVLVFFVSSKFIKEN